MALTTCRECGKEVSTGAESCPHCGVPRKRKGGFSIGRVLLLLILAAIGWYFLTPPSCKGLFRKVVPAIAPDPVTRLNKTVTVNEDQYWHATYNSKGGEVRVSVRVATGPAVDVYFMDASDLPKFPKGKPRIYPALSQGNTRRFSASGLLRAGSYVLIIDNTDYGEAHPPMNMVDDRATVEVKIEAD